MKVSIKDILKYPLRVIPVDGGNVMHGMKNSDNGFMKFGEAYKKLVKEHDGWSETDCVGFVHGDERFSELNRGTDINRLCIVDKLGDI